MSKSALLRQSDVLALMRHLADVAALPDPATQRLHMIDGLGSLLRARLGVWLVMDDWRPRRTPRAVHQVLTSRPDPFWVRYMSDFIVHHSASDDPYADRSIQSAQRTHCLKLTRLVESPQEHRRYGASMDMARKLRICDGVVAVVRLGSSGDRVAGFSLQRCSDSGPLTARDMALAKLAIDEIGRMIQRGVLPVDGAARPELPRRLQQVFSHLLQGDSPRQIALCLGISVHTVREHIERLYERFGVHSREDLMAKFVR